MKRLLLVDLLRRVRDRLAVPSNFCRYMPAQDRNGHYVHPRSPQACRWCLLGAVGAEFTGDWELHRAAVGILWDVTRARGADNIARWLDSPSVEHQDVLDVLDEAIEVITTSITTTTRQLEALDNLIEGLGPQPPIGDPTDEDLALLGLVFPADEER